MDLLKKIKTRFLDEPERYRGFLDILITRNDLLHIEKKECFFVLYPSRLGSSLWIVG